MDISADDSDLNRIIFDGEFTPEIRSLLNRKRRSLGLPYHSIATFLEVNWSTVRKWEMGPTLHCETFLRDKVEKLLNGDFDDKLRDNRSWNGVNNGIELPPTTNKIIHELDRTRDIILTFAHDFADSDEHLVEKLREFQDLILKFLFQRGNK